jgi:hypothetical protein
VIARLGPDGPDAQQIERRLLRLLEYAEADPETPRPDKDELAAALGKLAGPASQLVELVIQQSELFHDAQGEAFARLNRGDHHETLAIRSRAFRLYLAGTYYRETGSAVTGQAISDALNAVEACALFDSPILEVYRSANS